MKNARVLRSQAGFSLIELMVVVAIIGILATIAIPNFNRFQAKAKQSEAKTNLAAIYAAEQSFTAEWSTYYGDFMDIGFQPSGRLNYQLGFLAVGTAPAAPFVTQDAAATCFTSVGASCPAAFQIWQIQTNAAALTVPTQTAAQTTACGQAALTQTPAVNAFTAAGQAALGGAVAADVWSINEANILCNSVNGT